MKGRADRVIKGSWAGLTGSHILGIPPAPELFPLDNDVLQATVWIFGDVIWQEGLFGENIVSGTIVRALKLHRVWIRVKYFSYFVEM